MKTSRKPLVGLALGSGSARGWAHVGVIRALEEAGIRPDLVCGTSVGAMVAAAYAAGELDRFEQWVSGMGITDVVGFMDVTFNGGLIKGERLMEFFRRHVVDRPIGELAMPFAAVATSLETGAEVWLREGSTVEAVRASLAMPAMFTPVRRDGKLLVDGALVNPVPVSLARAMGAEILIAVDLNSDVVGNHQRQAPQPVLPTSQVGEWIRKLQDNLDSLMPAHAPEELPLPSMFQVVASSLNIMQVRITRSRMAGEPPDVIVAPRLGHFDLLDFHRAGEAIEEGRRAVEACLSNLRSLGIQSTETR
jgi:NTE family protein